MTVVGEGARVDRVVTTPAERRETILGAIRDARRQLTLSLFRCSDEKILREITRAVNRGVQVDVLVTSRSKGKKKLRRLWEHLATTGAAIHAYTDPVVKYHAKYLIADEGPAVVASLNFTRKCFRSTVDALVLTYDPAVVNSLGRLLAADRAGERLPSNLSDRLIVGPDGARRQLTTLLEGARTSIRLIDAKLSDPVIVRLLDARRADGVAVEVHTAKRLMGLRSHGKLLLIDDEVAVVGSLALATLSLDFRREVALVIRDRAAVGTVSRLFESITASNTPLPRTSISQGSGTC